MAGARRRAFAASYVRHTDRAAAVDHDALHRGSRDHTQVRAAPCGREMGTRGGVPEPVADVALSVSHALLALAVVVIGERVARGVTGGDERIRDDMGRADRRDAYGAIGATDLARTREALRSAEVRLD